MNILFLYTELADYTIACLRELKRISPDAAIKVVHSPVNKEAPFVFELDGFADFVGVDAFADFDSFYAHVMSFRPDIIVCSGWINMWYVRAARKMKSVPVKILCSDNQWNGSLKQRLLAVASPFAVRGTFSNIWIPGEPQIKFANMLGFRNDKILTGFYSCDVPKFNAYYQKHKASKSASFPKRFLCVARYITVKGYANLWQSFIEWKKQTRNDWELWCAGTGQEFEKRINHESIKHLGFVQGAEWDKVISETSVFVLPSLHEPWGVVVHEFAAAGYPLMLSKKVGASQAFLKEDNGYSFDPTSIQEYKTCFDRFAAMSQEKYSIMSARSVEYSLDITPQRWAHALLAEQI